MTIPNYKKEVLDTILIAIKDRPEVLAAWVGGSAATGMEDQFSDIDLCVVARPVIQNVMDLIHESLQKYGVTHFWQPTKSVWGEGMVQRVIYLKDSPKYFCVDVGIISSDSANLIKDFLEVERHGHAVICFDKNSYLKIGHTDADVLFRKQQQRVNEIESAFPVFKSLVLKELERGKSIDALGFYQNGVVRPLIEVMGMLYRPYKYDFGMRYIHKTFPQDVQKLIEDLNYVANSNELAQKILIADKTFHEVVDQVKRRTHL